MIDGRSVSFPGFRASYLPTPPLQQALIGAAMSWPALITPVLARAFAELKVSVSLWVAGAAWYAIHLHEGVERFELDYAAVPRRWEYNVQCLEKVLATAEQLVGEHAGLRDLFVPMIAEDQVRGVLVAGPFLTERPTGADILQRWHSISGSHGSLTDPHFAEHASAMLSTLTLQGPALAWFQRLLTCYVDLASGKGPLDLVAAEAEKLRRQLAVCRFPERMWRAARSIVEEIEPGNWAVHAKGEMVAFGIEQLPEQVAVCLVSNRDADADPVDDLVYRHTFQRACVNIATRAGNVVSGCVLDQGVTFLVSPKRPGMSARAKLRNVIERAHSAARELGFALHVGLPAPARDASYRAHYGAALAAAERALAQGVPSITGAARAERSSHRLRKLRAELARSPAERTFLFGPRFNQYVEAVLAHAGYRLEPVRAQLEAGLERLAEPLLATGALDEKSFDELCAGLEQASDEARTVMALAQAFRRAIADIEATVQHPTFARQERGTRRAAAFIHDHLAEPLTLKQMARVAGFAPDYFSRVFRRDQKTSFEQYLMAARLERAKNMLQHTTLNIESVGQLCGFRNRNYFHRQFKRRVGVTPGAFREAFPADSEPTAPPRANAVDITGSR